MRTEGTIKFLLVALWSVSLSVLLLSAAKAETVLTVSVDPIVIESSGEEECKLSWTAPIEREDGTPLSADEIASYTIYSGTSSGVYTRQVVVTTDTELACSVFEITEFVDHYFAGITTDTNGITSQLSNEAIKTGEQLKPAISPPKTIFFSGTIVIQGTSQ